MARSKWRVLYAAGPDPREFRSESDTYAFVDAIRTEWASGCPTSTVTVQVDEGFGWQPYEHVNFAEEN